MSGYISWELSFLVEVSHSFITYATRTGKHAPMLQLLPLLVDGIWAGATVGDFRVHCKSLVLIYVDFSVLKRAIG